MSDRRQRARVATFAAGALLSSLLVAHPALAQEPSVPASSVEIDRLELELEDAESRLAAIAAQEDDLEVEAVEARSRLEDADRAVAASVATQAQADAEQDVADEAAARASVRLREASDALATAEHDLAATRLRLAELRDQLRDRARAAYMQGSGFGIVELLLNIQDYDDISRVQLLVAEVIEHDDELVDEWVGLQILSEEQVEEAAEHRDRVDDAKQVADAAAEEARRAAAEAAEAAEAATDEQQRRAAVFDRAQDALQHLDRDRLEVESTIEALRAEIEAAEAAARAVVARAIERASAAAGVAQQAIAAAQAATRPDDASTTVPDGSDLDAPAAAPASARSGGSLCASSSGLAWPTSGCVNSGYGPRTAPTAGASSFHRGLDIAAPWGQEIHAVAAGVVWQASYSSGHGYVTVIDHGGGLFTLYAHQASLASVAVGEWVDAGQVIGAIGSTGISTGPHLHLEAHFGCAYACSKVDPAVLFR